MSQTRTIAVNVNQYQRIQDCITSKEAQDILGLTHEGTFVIKRSRLIHLNSDYEIFQMKKDEMFESFYARFSDLVNTQQNLDYPIIEGKQVKKVLISLPPRFREKIIVIEIFQKPGNLKIHKFIDDLQSFKIHYLLSKKGIGVLLLKSTQGDGSGKQKYNFVASDYSSTLNEKEMDFLAKKFINFF